MFSQFMAYLPSSEETWQYGKVLNTIRLAYKVNFSNIHIIGRRYSVAHFMENVQIDFYEKQPTEAVTVTNRKSNRSVYWTEKWI